MKQIVLEKLEWHKLVGKLSGFCRTSSGKKFCEDLLPNLSRSDIERRWEMVDPLREIIAGGYTPPLAELGEMDLVFRSISVGQLLGGEELRMVADLLRITKDVSQFCHDFHEKCSSLRTFKATIYHLPKIATAIDKAIDEEGQLRDDASPELSRIRKQKTSLRKNIEGKIKKFLHDHEYEKYIQDDFFTIRSDRYVVPVKLDGRGRIKGSIYDTSDSGQTLYIEPTQVAALNEELLELELSEKLEIIRIFRELGDKIKAEEDILKTNYHQLIELDRLTAEANLANEVDGRAVKIAESPSLNLTNARHPLLAADDIVANTVGLQKDQRVLVVSGPNAGGKTVVLKTVGLLHLMARAGLMIPADEESSLYLFDELFLELGDAQDLSANLSTFSGHMVGLKSILGSSNERTLVLLDEIAAGTEPQAGSAIAQAILEDLAERTVTTIVTTHFDGLKALASEQSQFRNGSMEFSSAKHKPTYKLLLDTPGQSYGIEIAAQMGMPDGIISRAKSLRGASGNRLDSVVGELNKAREELREKHEELETARMEVETQRAHWENAREQASAAKGKARDKLSRQYDDLYRDLRADYDEVVAELKKYVRKFEKLDEISEEERLAIQKQRQKGNESLDKLRDAVNQFNQPKDPESVGEPVVFEKLKEGDRVYIVSVGIEGHVQRVGKSAEQKVDVRAGLLNMQVTVDDLRALAKKKVKKTKMQTIKQKADKEIALTLKTATNHIDVRGMDIEDALDASWAFIDQALLRGEARILLIHGHGQNKLKSAVREALKNQCPYNIRFRAGEDSEGGDGVTIVALDQ